MSNVRRVYAEKKEAFHAAAQDLKKELRNYLKIQGLDGVRILIRYDVENISDEVFSAACTSVFSEPPVDDLYLDTFPRQETDRVFTVEYLPGQFDQRADSAEQCIRFLKEDEQPVIRSATTYVLSGEVSDEDLEAVIRYCINPVDSRLAMEEKPKTLRQDFPEPEDIKVFEGFREMDDSSLKTLYESLSLAMTLKDFEHIRAYFKNEEQRDPTVTEIRVLDTYWSDHCRHTTFSTQLKKISFDDGYYREMLEDSYKVYLDARREVYGPDTDRDVCLMDLALIAMKKLKKEGRLPDQEESDEINACSIIVPVDVDGKTEEWLLNFKNETHNHPTEIEPFGGAATCLGGAIRDPLSGRTYVYQAMRVTGAADPRAGIGNTLEGKLPQKKLVREAARGYSSYGNQIGLATGHVREIYHPDYVAKRMEIGAVLGAAPRAAVRRLTSDPGNIIILLGGRTGRDGIGGATGSSKAHTVESLTVCGAEVQKGNAPTERKLQRMFRRPEVARLIRKCNDFGAGGVSVAIGELADGLVIDLDKVPRKYAGLDGTELAISESQERMAVVVDEKDVEQFLAYAKEENLEATTVAKVTEDPRLVMTWRGKTIVDLSRAFLDTNGAHQETDVRVELPDPEKNWFVREKIDVSALKDRWLDTLADLNCCSQKGLVEMFDSSIGAASVLMPYGGKYQLTQTQVMAAKLPVPGGKTKTASLMSYGFDPYLSSWSPYHGAMYAVLESVAKIASAGGDCSRIRFTFQEYFRRMSEDPARWSQPFAALLGACEAQLRLGLPSIGGKDSMSGSFRDIDVPPTLVSFAVDVADTDQILSPELKTPGNKLVLLRTRRDEYDRPDWDDAIAKYAAFYRDCRAGRIAAAYAVDANGPAGALARMAFGNRLGVNISDSLSPDDLFAPLLGSIVAEVSAEASDDLQIAKAGCEFIGSVLEEPVLRYGCSDSTKLSLDEAYAAWTGTLESVFRTVPGEPDGRPAWSGAEGETGEQGIFHADRVAVCGHKLAVPRVFIPVFPGTNCEYDSAAAFERAGALPEVRVFRNMTAQDIRDSVEMFEKAIDQAQIIMFPGGFSAGDEPDGSAKFFATAFRNEKIKEAVHRLLDERDGLALGICNGFQALIKLGLVPNGRITGQDETSPTLTFNTIGRHISRMVYTKVMTNKSPWLSLCEPGKTYVNPASHGEGRFVAPPELINRLIENGQVATMYADCNGLLAGSDRQWNINGSYAGIEGILSPDGRVLGKMCHSERRGSSVAVNIYGEQDMKLFEAGTGYFR